jgi:YVTN family beta-propeller protein
MKKGVTRREVLKTGGVLASFLVFHQNLSWAKQFKESPVFALRGDGAVVVIDPATDEIVTKIATEGKGGTLGSITPKGDLLFVANNASGQRALSIIDTKKLTLIKNLETGNRPKHPVISPRGDVVAVNHSGIDDGKIRIVFVSTKSLEILKTLELPVKNVEHKGDFSMHGSWCPKGKMYAIGNYADNEFYLISGKDFALLSATPVEGNPHYFDFKGKELWVTVEFGEPKGGDSRPLVYIYDISNPKKPVHKKTLKVELTSDELTELSRIEGHHGNFTNDGKFFLVCNRGASPFEGITVEVYDAKGKNLVKRIASKVKGVGHAYISPDNRYAVITQYGDSKIEVISLKNFESVAVIDSGQGKHMGHAVFSKDGKKLYVSNRVADSVFVIDTQKWEIKKRILTGDSGQAQGQVVKDFYGVFERVAKPYLG